MPFENVLVTNGIIEDVTPNLPHQDTRDEVRIVSDKLVHKQKRLQLLPREASFLTPHFTEVMRTKGMRVERLLPKLVPAERLQELLANRDVIHQDDLIDLLCSELVAPNSQPPVPEKPPVYGAWQNILTIDDHNEQAKAPSSPTKVPNVDATNSSDPSYLQLSRADVEAFSCPSVTLPPRGPFRLFVSRWTCDRAVRGSDLNGL